MDLVTYVIAILYALLRTFAAVSFDLPYSQNCPSKDNGKDDRFVCNLGYQSYDMSDYYEQDSLLGNPDKYLRALMGSIGLISLPLALLLILPRKVSSAKLRLVLGSAFTTVLAVVVALWVNEYGWTNQLGNVLAFNSLDLVAGPVIVLAAMGSLLDQVKVTVEKGGEDGGVEERLIVVSSY